LFPRPSRKKATPPDEAGVSLSIDGKAVKASPREAQIWDAIETWRAVRA